MSKDKRLLEELDPSEFYRLCTISVYVAAAVLIVFMVGLGVLINQGKITTHAGEIASLLMALIAIIITIVFSRVSGEIRRAREKLEVIFESNKGNMEILKASIDSGVATVESALANLQSKLDFERMLRSLAPPEGQIAESESAAETEAPATIQVSQESDELSDEIEKMCRHLTYDEIGVLRIFEEAGEHVLSSDFFERCVRKMNIDDGRLRSVLQSLYGKHCLEIHTTALVLTVFGKALLKRLCLSNNKNQYKEE